MSAGVATQPSVVVKHEDNKVIKGIEAVTEPEYVLARDEVMIIEKEIDDLRKEVNSISTDLASVVGDVSSLWSRVKSFEDSWKSLYGRVRKLESIADKDVKEGKKTALAAKLIGSWKAQVCQHVKEGVCTAWRIGIDVVNEIREVFGDSAVKVVDGEWRLVVSSVPHVCALCPLFKMSKHKE